MESSSAGFVPVLRGTGLEVAEKWVKGSSKYELLNLSAQECVAVLEFLENLHKGGRICYGFHQDRFAQVTCYVPADGGHNHFHMVDVCSGGYCAASVQLKQQLKAANR